MRVRGYFRRGRKHIIEAWLVEENGTVSVCTKRESQFIPLLTLPIADLRNIDFGRLISAICSALRQTCRQSDVRVIRKCARDIAAVMLSLAR